MKKYDLGEIDTKFANLIWKNEPLKSGELVTLCEKELNWKKATTYTVLRKLCNRGIFKNENSVVTSIINRDEFYARQTHHFVEDSFGGSLPKFLTAFSSGKHLTETEIAQLQKLIDESKKQ
ncbi:MAG: BlaI/MecI/CopY family transcriptional regulator [Oscillospiraceae bacterium]